METNRTSNSCLKYVLLTNGNLHCHLGLEDNFWLQACLYRPDMTWYDPYCTPHTPQRFWVIFVFVHLFFLYIGHPGSIFRSSPSATHRCYHFWQVLPMVWVHQCGTWIYKKMLKGRWRSFVCKIIATRIHVTSKWSKHCKLVPIEIAQLW